MLYEQSYYHCIFIVFPNKTSFIFNVNKYIHLDEPHDN